MSDEDSDGTSDDHADGPLQTPDGRYIVVRGRLWRRTDRRSPRIDGRNSCTN